jgi:hypothetical protein
MAAQYGFLLDQIFNDFEIKKVYKNKYLNAIFEKLFVFKGRVVSTASQRSAILQKFTIRFLKIYHSNEVGYDSKLETLPSTISLNGYFQSWKYADYLIRKNSFELSSHNLSNWYFKMKKDAEIVKPVVLHVRRGDYKLVADKFGLLSKEYYLNALSFLPGHLKKREIWVFSNEIHLAKAMLSENGQYNFKFIESEKSSTPVEALLLMLQGHAHIIANSTFSYWGAYLSQNSEVIIAPTKWFQNMNDPKDLLPPNWLRVQSVWEN